MAIRDLLRGLVGEVPPEDAVCEFRCRKTDCRHGDWARCDFRLRGGFPADAPRDAPDSGSKTSSGS